MRVSLRSITGLVMLIALFLSGCANLPGQPPTGSSVRPTEAAGNDSSTRRVTILYTGNGRGIVDPYNASPHT